MYAIKQTKLVTKELIESIRANSEVYYNTKNISDKKIIDALQKMDNPKYGVTKALNRLLEGSYDSDDTNFCIEIALYGEIL